MIEISPSKPENPNKGVYKVIYWIFCTSVVILFIMGGAILRINKNVYNLATRVEYHDMMIEKITSKEKSVSEK